MKTYRVLWKVYELYELLKSRDCLLNRVNTIYSFSSVVTLVL